MELGIRFVQNGLESRLTEQADFNGDGIANGYDIGIMMSAWCPCGDCPQDLSGDGIVDSQDLGLLFSLKGPWTF